MPAYKDDTHSSQRKMVLNGKGQVSVSPDFASLRLGVLTSGESVTGAQMENARISQQVLQGLKQLGITDIQTVQYQIDQLVDFQNGQRINQGYQVRNVFEVTTGDIARVGTVIDTAVKNGANIVESIRFDISKPELYYQQALNLAVKNAINKAKGIGSSLKIPNEPIPVLITENSLAPIPYTRSLAMRGEIAATPIEPGQNDIEASVTVEFTY